MKKKITFLPLLLSYPLSIAGTILYSFGLNWILLSMTKSTTSFGLISAITSGSLLIFNLFGGGIADIYSRKKIMMLSDLLSATVLIISAIFILLDIHHMVVVLAVVGIVNSFSLALMSPAMRAFIPVVIPDEDDRSNYNSIQSGMVSIVKIAVPLVGGILINLKFMTLLNLLLLNGISFFASFLLIYVTKSNEKTTPVQGRVELRKLLASVVDGIKWVKQHNQIKILILAVAIFNFFSEGYTLTLPFLIKENFFGADISYSNLILFESIGGVLGSFMYVFSKKKGGHWSLALAGFSILAMVLLNRGYFVYCFSFLVGISITYFNIYFVSKLQKDVEQEFMGRVFSVVYIAAALLVPVADLLFGTCIPNLREKSLILIGVGVSLLPFILQYVDKKKVN
ncbi:MFS transporter [Leuconostoc citreum]|uniref:MFS transporter n=1 Tax=Leuconostoc citreum TaxID=33964 RepID=UPI0032DFE08E